MPDSRTTHAWRPTRPTELLWPLRSASVDARFAGSALVAAEAARRRKGDPVRSSSTRQSAPEGPGSGSRAPNPPPRSADASTSPVSVGGTELREGYAEV